MTTALFVQVVGRALRPMAWHNAHNDPCDDMPVHVARRWAGLRPCGHKLTSDPGCNACQEFVQTGRTWIDRQLSAVFSGEEGLSYGRQVPRRPGCP